MVPHQIGSCVNLSPEEGAELKRLLLKVLSNVTEARFTMTQSQVTITSSERETAIVRTSAIGIAANVALAVFKAVVGILSNSIAVTLDAVNNLSDAISSIITIVGTKLSNKKS